MSVDLAPKPFPGENASDFESALQSFEDQGGRDGIAEAFDMPEGSSAEAQEPLKPVFAIDSEERANWYLRKLANISAERQRVKANSALMLADLKREEERLKLRFEPQLRQWVKDELLRRNARTKKLVTFQGIISFRNEPARYSITDSEAALVYARTFVPELIEQRPCLIMSAYVEASKASHETETLNKDTGEMVPGNLFPGTEIKPGYESMLIKFVAPVGEEKDGE